MQLRSPSRLSTDALFIGALVFFVGFIFWVSAYRPSLEIKRQQWLAMPDSLAKIARQDSIDKARLDSLNRINKIRQDSINNARKLDSIALAAYKDSLTFAAKQRLAYLDSIKRAQADSLRRLASLDSLKNARKLDSIAIAAKKRLAYLDSLNKLRRDSLRRLAYLDSLENARIQDSIALADSLQNIAAADTASLNNYAQQFDSLVKTLPLPTQPEPIYTSESFWLAFVIYLVLFGIVQVWVYMIIRKLWSKKLAPQIPQPLSKLDVHFQREELIKRLLAACFTTCLSNLLLLVYAPGLPMLINTVAIFYLVLKYGAKDIDYLVFHAISQHLTAVICQTIISITTYNNFVFYYSFSSWADWSTQGNSLVFLMTFVLIFFSIFNTNVAKSQKGKIQRDTPNDPTKTKQAVPKVKPKKSGVKGKITGWTGDLHLPTLTQLDLSHRMIRSTDQDFLAPLDECENLRSLDMSHNLLDWLPYEIEFLEQLETLNVANNKISDLTDFDFSLLTKLKVVDFTNNNLMQLPDELLELPHLERLELRGNPFSNNAIKRFRKKATNKELIIVFDKREAQTSPPKKSDNKEKPANTRVSNEAINTNSDEKNLALLTAKLKERLKSPKNVTHIPELSSCGLTGIPAGFLNKFPKLTYLNLAGNPLKTLPTSLLECKETLKELYIPNCQLTEIPEWLLEFPSLEVLNIGNNPLQNFPFFISDLPKLINLQIDYLGTTLSQSIICDGLSQLPQLKKLSLRSIDFGERAHADTLFTVLNRLENLISLDFSFCNLQFFPDFIVDKNNLEELFFSGNKIKELPTQGWENLKKLRTIYAGYNSKDLINEEIIEAWAKLPALYTLDLGGSKLQSLPKNIALLKQIKTLSLQYNELDYLPAQLLELDNLIALNLYNNNIQFLPEKIDKMASLERLSLENNPLQTVPDSLLNLKELIQLSLPQAWSKNQREALRRRLPDTVVIQWK